MNHNAVCVGYGKLKNLKVIRYIKINRSRIYIYIIKISIYKFSFKFLNYN